MTNNYTFRSKDFALMFCSLESARLIEPKDTLALISLNDPGLLPELDYTRWKHCLRVRFHDITDIDGEGEVFTERMAESIIEFAVCLPKQVNFLITHCYAGISRSSAVTKFLTNFIFTNCYNETFDLGYDAYNKTVYKVLVKTWEKRQKQGQRHT